MLWERSGPAQQRASLSQELKTLRRALAAAGAGSLLSADRLTVRLDLELLGLDLPSDRNDGTTALPEPGEEFLEGLELPGCLRWSQWMEGQRARVRAAGSAKSDTLRSIARAYGAPVPTASELLAAVRPSRPPKPSVAVLPFEIRAGDDQFLGVALADGLAVRLTHFPQIFVAGSASAAAMARMGLLREEIAARLGVRYTIDGLIIRRGDRFRVSVALVDSDSGEQVWGEVFTEVADGTGAFEDCMVDRIAPQLWSRIDTSERRTSMARMGVGSDRYERWWRASALYRSFRKQDVLEARAMAERLAEEDRTCPFCASLAAFLSGLGYLLGSLEPDPVRRAVERYSAQALQVAPDNPEILGYCAGAQLLSGADLEVADSWITRALQLLPGYQPSLFWGGWIDIARGRTGRARERLELALRINPATGVRGPTLCALGMASLLEGKLDEAQLLLREAHASDPGFPLTDMLLAIAAMAAGDLEEAKRAQSRLDDADPLRLIGLLQSPQHQTLIDNMLRSPQPGSAEV